MTGELPEADKAKAWEEARRATEERMRHASDSAAEAPKDEPLESSVQRMNRVAAEKNAGKPFPGMLANQQEYSPEEERSIISAGGTPDAARKAGIRPGTVPTAPAAPSPPLQSAQPGADLPPVRTAPTQIVPAGFRPDTMSTSVKEGVPVPAETREASAAGTALELSGVAEKRAAEQALYDKTRGLKQAEMQAASDAAVAHQDVEQRRDAEVRQRLSEIEDTNTQASAGIDPGKFWKDRGTLARVVGTISVALGGGLATAFGGPNRAGEIIDSAINRDIQAQIQNRESARETAKGQISLLRLHQERLGSEDKAIDATKLAYYENILQQISLYKEENGLAVDDANFKALTADILERYGALRNKFAVQEFGERGHEFKQKYHSAQAGGGAVGALAEHPNLVRLSDGTVVQFQNEPSRNEAAKKVGVYHQLKEMNTEALGLRAEAQKIGVPTSEAEYERLQAIKKTLNDLQQRKMEVVSISAGQGVLRKEDVLREEEYGIDMTSGIGFNPATAAARKLPWAQAEGRATEEALKRQAQRYGEQQRLIAESEGGHVVTPGYVSDPVTGELRPVTRYQGKDTQAREPLPPSSFRPYGNVRSYNAPERSLAEETPKAPNFGAQAAKPSAGKKKKAE